LKQETEAMEGDTSGSWKEAMQEEEDHETSSHELQW
jgi:hypothetical protein